MADKQFSCKQCDKWFIGNSGLYHHNKSNHEGVKYSCTDCEFKATLKQTLQRHLAVAHEGLCMFHCNQCAYKAAQKINLQYQKN